jgi:CTP:phosphocholine cytidylyltransferase-like protein
MVDLHYNSKMEYKGIKGKGTEMKNLKIDETKIEPTSSKLKVGNEYFFSYICSSDRYGPIRIVKRTEKNIWYVNRSDTPARRKIRYDSDSKIEKFYMDEKNGTVWATNIWYEGCR